MNDIPPIGPAGDWLAPGLLVGALGMLWLALAPRLAEPARRAWSRYVLRAAAVRDRFYLELPAERLAGGMLAAGLVLGLAWGLVQRSVWHGVAAVTMGLALPGLCTAALWRRRMEAIARQLGPAIGLMASRWRNSTDIADSFRVVEAHMEPPISQEAQLTLRELRLGVPPAVALTHLERRVPLPAMQLLCAGVRHALPAGGDVARVLDRIGDAVSEAERLRLLIETRTAQGRIQAWVMAVMPPLVVVGLGWLDPSLIEPLFETPTGHIILLIAVVLDLVGVLLVRRLTDIRP